MFASFRFHNSNNNNNESEVFIIAEFLLFKSLKEVVALMT